MTQYNPFETTINIKTITIDIFIKHNTKSPQIEQIFDKHQAKYIKTLCCKVVSFIPNCNYILIEHDIIFDLDSYREMRLLTPIAFGYFFVFFVGGLILAWHHGFIEIYETKDMIFAQRIDTELVFTYYNQMTNVLVTDTKSCYRLKTNSKHYLQKVVLGVDYVSDYDVVPKNIKNMIEMFCEILLYDIPPDILFTDLYGQFLRIFVY